MIARLVPMVVFSAVAAHSGGAMQERFSSVIGMRDQTIVKQRMEAVLEYAELRAIGDDEMLVSTPAQAQTFVRKAIRIKKAPGADAAKDPWGTFYRMSLVSLKMTIISAGPDKSFSTKDDVVVARNIYDY